MIVLSLNIKGLGNTSKKLALSKLIQLEKLDITMLQESMERG